MTLEEEVQQLRAELNELKALNAQLQERLTQLETLLAQNSRNSSKPPSSDGFNRPPKNKNSNAKKPNQRKSGGQPGHSPHNLLWQEQPTRVVEHLPTHCQHCQATLEPVLPHTYQKRQVLDLPPELKLETVEHRAWLKTCPHCQHTTQAAFPAFAKGWLQYGPTLRALAVYLSQVQLLPYARTCEVLNELFGLSLSEGSLYQMLVECYDHLAEPTQVIRQGLMEAQVVHNDETGLYVQGSRQWLHVMCNADLTFYAFHRKRGKAATDAIGLLPQFSGISVHDAWASYFANEQCQHALCNAHHLRELTFVAEDLGQTWAKALIELLLALKAAVAIAQAQGLSELDSARLSEWQSHYQNILAEGHLANPPPVEWRPGGKRGRLKQSKAKNLVDRLAKHEREVLGFALDFRIPFDNNQAERDLRMVKVQQKVSNCFRSQQGAEFFCRIRSYTSTLRKQGQSAFNALKQAFLGQPLLPVLPS